ncbi:hypothetical protein pb186bvf_006745 [Paramecium bursaria]
MSHHHGPYYATEDGYQYTSDELDAYRVPRQYRNRCVNLYVPYLECRQEKTQDQSTLTKVINQLDNWDDECYEQRKKYNYCNKQHEQLAIIKPTRDLYYNSPWYAASENVSSTYQNNYRTAPFVLF